MSLQQQNAESSIARLLTKTMVVFRHKQSTLPMSSQYQLHISADNKTRINVMFQQSTDK